MCDISIQYVLAPTAKKAHIKTQNTNKLNRETIKIHAVASKTHIFTHRQLPGRETVYIYSVSSVYCVYYCFILMLVYVDCVTP